MSQISNKVNNVKPNTQNKSKKSKKKSNSIGNLLWRHTKAMFKPFYGNEALENFALTLMGFKGGTSYQARKAGLKRNLISQAKSDKIDEIANTVKNLINDPQWYQNYPLMDMVNANYGVKKTTYLNENGITYAGENGDVSLNVSIPSVQSFIYTMTVPYDDNSSWAVSIDRIYQFLRHANAGAIDFTVYDLEHYILAAAGIHTMLSDLIRTYGILNTYSLYDSTLPASIFAAVGKDYLTFRDNSAELRNLLNLTGLQIEQLIPLRIDYFERCQQMTQNIYTDSDDAKAQLIVTSPASVFIWDPIVNGIVQTDWGVYNILTDNTGRSYNDVTAIFKRAINAFCNNNVFSNIAGVILRAYQGASLYNWNLVPEDYQCPMVYSTEILMQLQNATVLGDRWASIEVTSGNNQYTQTKFELSTIKGFTANQMFADFKRPLINAPFDRMTETDTIIASRLICAEDPRNQIEDKVLTDTYYPLFCGTEVIVKAFSVAKFDGTGTYLDLRLIEDAGFVHRNLPDGNSDAEVRDYLFSEYMWAATDWMPRLRVFDQISQATRFQRAPLWDWNNFAVTNPILIATTHGLATMNVLYVAHLLKSNATILID